MEQTKHERPDGFWGVRDSNARMLNDEGEPVPRTHEPVRGRTYKLYFDRETFMPEDHARKFLRDPAFIVTDANGDAVASLSRDALKRTIPNENLPPNMVIASVEELTHTALMTRCAQRPRAPKFTPDTPRDTMIRFLQDEFYRDENGEDPSGNGAEPGEAEDLDEMSPQFAEKLLQGG